MLLFRILRILVKPFAILLYGLRHEGRENIPQTGSFIIASNHVHLIDPALHGLCSRRTFKTMAKNELMHAGLFTPLLKALGAFGVKRGTGDKAALDQAVDILRSGDGLLVFPEGTRSKTWELGSFKPGIVYIAKNANAPIVPAAIIARKGIPLFSKVVVRYGPPVTLEELGCDANTPEERRVACEAIRERVQQLMMQDGEKTNG